MTFGQPRIGNAIFATYYSELVPNSIRVTNGNDVVPHLPPYYTYFPQKTYHHFPTEVFFSPQRWIICLFTFKPLISLCGQAVNVFVLLNHM